MGLINDYSLYRIEEKRLHKKAQMFTSFAYATMSHSYEALLFERKSRVNSKVLDKIEYESIDQNWLWKYRIKLSMKVLDKTEYESIG